ncbi:MAG: type toxin-antitoxin system VapC family toxin [Frondihabitans sp.]|nr:type toxin-antitoxin system VapC family toxin [Frondihabitans sp.]
MGRRLIVDTGVLVASERGIRPLATVVQPEDDLVIAAVTIAELQTGVELASEARRVARARFVLDVLTTLPIEAYDQEVAVIHGRLLAHAHRTGTKRGAHDLLIAATAGATGRIILTTDAKASFHDLPGVECLVVA